MNEYRWSIAELQTRYDLEPDLADVFVEGIFDCEVLSGKSPDGAPNRTVYHVDVVDVPIELLSKHSLSCGNKQRVIALARELSILQKPLKVVCLVDRDLDHWFGDLESSNRLRWTKFCSIENHFLSRQIAFDVLVTTAQTRIKNIDPLFASIGDILRKLYALRLADRELSLALEWVSLKKRYLRGVGDTLQFNEDDYITALLNRNAKASRLVDFLACYKRWLEQLNCDLRLSARGHDYVELLAVSVTEFGGYKEFANTVSVERLFVLLARNVSTLPEELQ